MNTEYGVGRFRIRFESRARRRWLVMLFYAVLAALGVVWISMQSHSRPSLPMAWIDIGLGILMVVLFVVLTWLSGDIRMWGDERETNRREHAYAVAYRVVGGFTLAAVLLASSVWGPNPVTPFLPPAAQLVFTRLPLILLLLISVLFITLPQAMLLWTEPDIEEEQ